MMSTPERLTCDTPEQKASVKEWCIYITYVCGIPVMCNGKQIEHIPDMEAGIIWLIHDDIL